jgi:hypothetical protein
MVGRGEHAKKGDGTTSTVACTTLVSHPKIFNLGCEYLSECVHLSIVISEIKIFLAIILIILELDPFLFGRL